MGGAVRGIHTLWVSAALCCLSMLGTTAHAQAPPQIQPVVVDTTKPTLAEKDGGGWTAKVAVTNLTSEPLVLSAQPQNREDRDCTPSVPEDLPAVETTAVTVDIDATCELDDGAFKLEIAASRAVGGEAVASVGFTAQPAAEKGTDWGILKSFLLMTLAVALLALLAFRRWVKHGYLGSGPADQGDADQNESTSSGDAPDPPKRHAGTPLSSLEKSWSLKDSWVSNITLGTALITGVFGSTEAVTAILGEDAKTALAKVIVGSAIAAGLVAVGPLILAATQTNKEKFTVGGLFLATTVVLGGALGELWVVTESATSLPLGSARGWLPWVLVVVVVALLLIYTFRNVDLTLRAGTAPPDEEPPPDALIAAGLIVNALHPDDPSKQISAEQVARVIRALERQPPDGPLTEEAIGEMLSYLYGDPARPPRTAAGPSSRVAMI